MTNSEKMAIREIAKQINLRGHVTTPWPQLIKHIDRQRQKLLAFVVPPSRTPEYIARQSKKRRQAAANKLKCILCQVADVTPGLHGPKQRPYSTCETCRKNRRKLMSELRARKKSA